MLPKLKKNGLLRIKRIKICKKKKEVLSFKDKYLTKSRQATGTFEEW